MVDKRNDPEATQRSPMLSLEEAGRQIGVSRRTMEGWVATRKIKYTKVMGHLVKIHQETVDELLRAGEVQPLADKKPARPAPPPETRGRSAA